MIRPVSAKEVTEYGWYLLLDIKNQNSKDWAGIRHYGAWFYEFKKDGWYRNYNLFSTDGNSFDCTSRFVGPLDLSEIEEYIKERG